MRRRLSESEDLERPVQINVVPLIDVLFALLTFFILSTLFLVRSEGLPVNLPKATTAKTQAASRATVTLDKQGKLYFNRSLIAVESLAAVVRRQMTPGENLTVVINADGSVTHDHFVAVLDQLRQVPGVRIAIATRRQ